MIKVGEFRKGMPLSELIQLAVNDARRAVATGKYVLDGGFWHEPAPERGVCRICLGGGVLAGLTGFNSKRCADESHISPYIELKLFEVELEVWETELILALDEVRVGNVESALERLECDWHAHHDVVLKAGQLIFESYDSARCDSGVSIAPLETYEAAAQILAEVGL